MTSDPQRSPGPRKNHDAPDTPESRAGGRVSNAARPRVVIISQKDHYYANLVMKKVIEARRCDVALVALSDIMYPGKTKSQSLRMYFGKAGARYTFAMMEKMLLLKLLSAARSVCPRLIHESHSSFAGPARERGVEIILENDFRNPAFIEKVRGAAPDFILSVFSRHIFRKPLLEIPKFHCVNAHPALLPEGKGVSPVFWALSENAAETGATLHIMDEGIDTGAILSQAGLKVRERDTEHSLYYKLSLMSAAMINEFFSRPEAYLEKAEKADAGRGKYHSIPTREAFARLRRHRRRLFTIRELLSPPELNNTAPSLRPE